MDILSFITNEGYKPIKKIGCANKLENINEIKSISCARNDYAYFQLILYSKQNFTVSVSNTPAFNEYGIEDVIRVDLDANSFNKDEMEIKIVEFLKDDDNLYKGDLISNIKEKYVYREEICSLFIKVKIDKNITPGDYCINVNLFHSKGFEPEKLLESHNLELKIFNFTMPNPKDYKIHLDLWQHYSNLARKYDLELWSDKHFEIIDNYLKSLEQLGQKVISVVASEVPWCGQQSFLLKENNSNLFEYSCIKVFLDKNKSFRYDFRALDRLIDVNFKNNIQGEIEVFGLIGVWEFKEHGYPKIIKDYDDAARIRYFDENTNTYSYISTKKDYALYLKAIEDYFIQKGVIDIVRVVADEPSDMEKFKKAIDFVSQVAPKFKFKAAINHKEFLQEKFENLIDFAPMLPFIFSNTEIIKEMKRKTPNSKISTYVCCWPDYPNTFLKSAAYETRVIFWLINYFELDGFLRWNYIAWTKNPTQDIIFPRWPAGDTNFIYPGKDLYPMFSIRYYVLKKGIRDYELAQLCKNKIEGEDFIQKLQERIIKFEDFSSIYESDEKINKIFIDDYSKYEEISEQMLGFLSE